MGNQKISRILGIDSVLEVVEEVGEERRTEQTGAIANPKVQSRLSVDGIDGQNCTQVTAGMQNCVGLMGNPCSTDKLTE